MIPMRWIPNNKGSVMTSNPSRTLTQNNVTIMNNSSYTYLKFSVTKGFLVSETFGRNYPPSLCIHEIFLFNVLKIFQTWLDNVYVDGAQRRHNPFLFHKPSMMYKYLQRLRRFTSYWNIQSNLSLLENIMGLSPFELFFGDGDESLKVDIFDKGARIGISIILQEKFVQI